MMPPTSIDGTDITGATIDGTDVQEITVDGDTVFTAEPQAPTAGLLHQWDFSHPSTTTGSVPDLVGSATVDEGSFSGFTTINGVQAGDFDGSDGIRGDFSGSEPAVRFSVAFQSDDTRQQICDGYDTEWHSPYYRPTKGGYAMWNGNNLFTSIDDNNPHVVTCRINPDNSGEIRVDSNRDVVSGGGLTIGYPGGISIGVSDLTRDVSRLDGAVGEILEYDPTASGYDRLAVEQYLSNKWSISLV